MSEPKPYPPETIDAIVTYELWVFDSVMETLASTDMPLVLEGSEE